MKFIIKNKMIILIICILTTTGIYLYNENKEIPKDNNQSTENIDTDGDSIPDIEEKNIYKTDPTKKDTDNDSIDDHLEILQNTNPTTEDTDGDGLLDGKAQYINNKMIAPKDPVPTIMNGKKGIWKKQIEIEKKGNIPSYLTTFYQYTPTQNTLNIIKDVNWSQIQQSKNPLNEIIDLPIIKQISSNFLNFRLDNGGIILHSQTKRDIYNYIMTQAKAKLPTPNYLIFETAIKSANIESSLETWQKQFGYNRLYDEVFRKVTNNNMNSNQLYFTDNNGQQYVIWMWKGYYLALGGGAEIGIYKKSTTVNNHWDAVDFEVPMTLNLYNYYSENNIEHIFSWAPTNKQWWITGFNTNHKNVDVTKQVLLGTINLSQHQDMYKSLKLFNATNASLIFDDKNYTIWINW